MIYRYRAKLAQASFVTITRGLHVYKRQSDALRRHFLNMAGLQIAVCCGSKYFWKCFFCFSLSFIDNEISNINKISPATDIFKVELLSDATSDVIERFLYLK